MKFRFTILTCLLLAGQLNAQVWIPEFIAADDPSGEMEWIDIMAVDMISEDLIWVGGAESYIAHSTDGGETWVEQHWDIDNYDYEIRDIFFVNEELGFALNTGWENWTGENVDGLPASILKTVNGGVTWTTIFEDTDGNGIRSIEFVDENVGYAVGGNGYGIRTTDGGATWVEMDMGTTNILTGVQFVSSDQGWCIGSATVLNEDVDGEYIPLEERMVLKTTNGGDTWSHYIFDNTPHYYLTDLQMFESGVGYVAENEGGYGLNSRIYKTDDFGDTWTELDIPDYNDAIYAIHFDSELNGWAVGGSYCTDFACLGGAYIIHTNDGGETWVVQKEEIDSWEETQLYRIWAIDAYDGNLLCVGSPYNDDVNAFSAVTTEGGDNAGIVSNKTEGIVEVFPVPCNNVLTVNNGINGDYIRIMDMLGRVVYENDLGNTLSIDFGTYAPGNYILELLSNNESVYKQHVVKE